MATKKNKTRAKSASKAPSRSEELAPASPAPTRSTPPSEKLKPAKAEKAAKRAKPEKTAKPARPARPAKEKRIRGSFSIPASDYALIAELKARSKQSGRTVKKNALLRAGLRILTGLSDVALQQALTALPGADSTAGTKAKTR